MHAKKNLPIVDWLQINSSAPGKFIICGEYSVVYDKQAIAAAVDLRTRVTIRPNKDADKVRVNLKNLNHTREWPTASLTSYRLVSRYSECLEYTDFIPPRLAHLLRPSYIVSTTPAATSSSTDTSIIGEPSDALDKQTEIEETKNKEDKDKKADDATIAFLLLYIGLGDSYCNSARPPIIVDIESSIPVGSGLGSSSAFAVSLCGALMRVFRVAAERHIIANWAYNVEKYFHGRPSGIDNNVSAVGGCILFQNNRIRASCTISAKKPIRVLLIDTGVSRSTKALIENVKKQIKEEPVEVVDIFNSIDSLANQIWRKLTEQDFRPYLIADYLESNQHYLDRLGVGHEKLADICEKATRFNLRAKQTGAGGGGTAFVLYDDLDSNNVEKLKKILVASGYRVHDHDVGCEGLKVDIVPDPDNQFPFNLVSNNSDE